LRVACQQLLNLIAASSSSIENLTSTGRHPLYLRHKCSGVISISRETESARKNSRHLYQSLIGSIKVE
jgi:hypothetical protein